MLAGVRDDRYKGQIRDSDMKFHTTLVFVTGMQDKGEAAEAADEEESRLPTAPEMRTTLDARKRGLVHRGFVDYEFLSSLEMRVITITWTKLDSELSWRSFSLLSGNNV